MEGYESPSNRVQKNQASGDSQTKPPEREQWGNKIQFFLAVAGNIVGLGNVWRFPYLCYKNGGGAFFIPYVLFLVTCGIPLFFLETSLGQYTSQGGITCWKKICPLFQGLGYGNQVVILYTGVYYIVILAWAILYLFSSFHAELPWATCRNSWNTDSPIHSLTSFVAGFAIFSVLGFMAHEQGMDISMVAESAYPRAVSMMPLPQLWAIFFFIMIIFLGLDSEFVNQEALVTAFSDLYPSVFKTGVRRKLLLLAICVGSFLIGLLMVTEGGLYIFLLFDHYACSGMTFLFFAILESACVGWVYGSDRYYDNVQDMIGYRPWPFMKYCWQYVTPTICTCTLVFYLAKYTPLKFNNTYEYPWWGYVIGGFLTLSSTMMVPLWMLYAMTVTPGSLSERVKVLCSPAKDLPCSSTKTASNPEAFHTFTELCTLRTTSS
ncbi:hypothetical protein NHX12_029619 [Muraenolepis orangiensis]|uniref:Transporter n=1 Tax=Muraenolepis orangiensis TaxID=630683 RepID=A0A9Q0IIQ2_9TELE|nr:hypothetical protein NHX12_029619 [Muraenolepis orangiensis]